MAAPIAPKQPEYYYVKVEKNSNLAKIKISNTKEKTILQSLREKVTNVSYKYFDNFKQANDYFTHLNS